MEWGDLALRLIRFAGALTSAAAGIAALLSDGAFIKREQTLTGLWQGSPFARYRVTRWGAFLLAVILLAPTVQFFGDWIKDASDMKTLNETAGAIRRDIDSTVQMESQIQLEAAKRVISQATAIGTQTSEILKSASDQLTKTDRLITEADRSIRRFSFIDVSFLYTLKPPSSGGIYAPYLERVRKSIASIPKNPEISILGRGYWESTPPKNGVIIGLDGAATIYPGSALLPNRETKAEQHSWDNMHNFEYTLLFYRGPGINLSRIAGHDVADLAAPDLTVTLSFKPEFEDRMRFVFNPKTDDLVVIAKQIRSTSADWIGTGRIIGGNDLGGVQLILKVTHSDDHLGLQQIILNIANEFELTEEDFHRVPGKPLFYEFRFPIDGSGARFRLGKLNARRSLAKAHEGAFNTVVSERWCDVQHVWALHFERVPNVDTREPFDNLCRGDVTNNGGRAPVGSGRDSLYGDQLDWQRRYPGSNQMVTCSCIIDTSRIKEIRAH